MKAGLCQSRASSWESGRPACVIRGKSITAYTKKPVTWPSWPSALDCEPGVAKASFVMRASSLQWGQARCPHHNECRLFVHALGHQIAKVIASEIIEWGPLENPQEHCQHRASFGNLTLMDNVCINRALVRSIRCPAGSRAKGVEKWACVSIRILTCLLASASLCRPPSVCNVGRRGLRPACHLRAAQSRYPAVQRREQLASTRH